MKSSLVLVAILSSFIEASEVIHDGYIRTGYQYQDEGEFAVGGKLHVEIKPRCDLAFGASFFTTQGVDKKYNDGINFFSNDAKSYSILGEAYMRRHLRNTTLTVGRQEINTPYADSDDIGMVPNTFDAVTAVSHDFKDTTIFAGYLKKMSGVDSQKPEKFNDIGDVYTLGLIYEGFEDIALSGWYYDAQDLAKITYLEAGYEKKFSDLNFDFDFQYSNQEFNHEGNVNIYGANFAVSKSGVTASVAYDKTNSTEGQIADNFFGGGPFFINCEHDTLAEVGADGEGIRYGLELDVSEYGVDGLGLFLSYLEADGKDSDINEVDFVVNYELNDKLSFDLIYSDTDDNLDNSNSFTNTRFFANYSF